MSQFTQTIEELDNCFVKTAGNIIKHYDDEEERHNILKDLKDILKNNCTEYAKLKAANAIRLQMERRTDDNESTDAVKNITKKYAEAIAAIKVNPLEDNRLLEYNRQIEGLLQANEAACKTAPDDTDADLQLTDSQINVIDPISKMRMTDPVRNMVCGHVYDRESLVAMLRKNKNTRCPVVGCTSQDYIVLSQCRPDIVTKTYLERNPA
ncbi:E3 SUMO-protein ligase NSE2 [Monomorium pharaonis]|uniref:E3 SUMO-protein ligase NSE2 n=1 Tax=Monomorium pharaonis TaxID=307658 RepID=UPI00063F4780|nr:E3 SUMO-protein ligase NSE2 [Monomorium pharaonis]